MSGTTPGGGAEQEPQQDPFGQPSEPPGQGPPPWRDNELPQWPGSNDANAFGDLPEQPPTPILTAAKLMYVGALLSLLGGIFAFLGRDDVREEAIRQNDDFTAEEIDSFVNTFVGTMVVVAVLSVALWLWMASVNKKGRSWARVVASVLGGLNILFGLWGLTAGGFDLGTLINLISPVLAGAILYLLYRPEASEYYRRMSTPRAF